jgi:triosephosphate isomerase (TIM)
LAASTRPPRLIVNLKAYPQTLGARAVKLANAARKLDDEYDVGIVLCPQAVDARACAATGALVYAQHFDLLERPEATGWQSIESLVDAGCTGTLINHSEHRIASDRAADFVQAARGVRFTSVLCTKDSQESEKLAKTRPDMVAVEPPELIGGDVSVTTADPQVVARSVAAARRSAPKTLVLCGAGIKNRHDVAKAIELGAHGILVASGVTKAKDPAAAIADLAEGFRL